VQIGAAVPQTRRSPPAFICNGIVRLTLVISRVPHSSQLHRDAGVPGERSMLAGVGCRGPRRAFYARRGGMSGVFVVPEGAWGFSPTNNGL
jgi:hypothetical protein